MLQAEYIRDMHSNFVVLKGIEGKSSAYGSRMILHNNIPGLLKTELRSIDNMDLFYYDVTSKKSLAEIWENKSLNYYELRKIVSDILITIQNSGEYLLSENDFIIEPNYIFLDTGSQNILLCHLVGRDENIKEQLSRLMEYLMNKVDYKDEAAVVLIYALYKESKETDCTFEKLLKEINKKDNEPKVRKINVQQIEKMEHRKPETDETYSGQSGEKTRKFKAKETLLGKPSIQDLDSKKNQRVNFAKEKYKNQKVHNQKNKNQRTQNQKTQKQLDQSRIRQKNQKRMSQNEKDQNGKTQKTLIQNARNHNVIQPTQNVFVQKNFNKITHNPGYQSSFHQNITILTGKIQFCIKNLFHKFIVKSTELPPPSLENLSELEEVESEREVQYFGLKTFVLAGISILAGIIILIIALQFNLLDNTFGTQIDSIKLISCIIILACMEAYALMKLFDTKNKLSRIKTVIEYAEIEPGDAESKPEYAEINADKVAESEPEYEEKNTDKEMIWEGSRCFDDKDSQVQETTQFLWQKDSSDEAENTVILSQLKPWKQYHLVRSDNEIQKEIPVDHFPFLIGKLKKGMDLLIEDTSVSRRHAKFTKEGEDIFLTDLNSTNGTYINGIRMAANKPYLLHEKDEIVFSQVKYIWSVLIREN
ncbi:DUF6382 domain-containing protein [Anaerocolumna sp. AGMB13025]|uniref:DUF6382 domain-containing protein n=1 Tax=Anaerocolumna sp. AGMB13025 TaxID=3039116 RepID=UPI00241C5945|nr:DUF6382 domain-containing protein [Anaerocolumna sp. AGMB13025]WFR57560.1 DUF6382 domain-containing protein [Anaerocolumna sp. AGMB13025]